jgi:hypothetical protein
MATSNQLPAWVFREKMPGHLLVVVLGSTLVVLLGLRVIGLL